MIGKIWLCQSSWCYRQTGIEKEQSFFSPQVTMANVKKLNWTNYYKNECDDNDNTDEIPLIKNFITNNINVFVFVCLGFWNSIIWGRLLYYSCQPSHIHKCWNFISSCQNNRIIYIWISSRFKWFCLVWFYGWAIIVGYLMWNPVFIYILNIWFVNTFCRYTQLKDQTVLFLTIQFSLSQQS